jgi:hypothetical protein
MSDTTSSFRVTLSSSATPNYKVTLANSTNLQVRVNTQPLREALMYNLDTTVNTDVGILTLAGSVGNTTDSVSIVGAGITTVSSNGTAIIISANSAALRLDTLSDVIEGVNPSNNSTLVYNTVNDKYEVKELNIDGGSF